MNGQLTHVKKLCREGDYKNALKSIECIENHDFDYWILHCEICIALKSFKMADDAISHAIHINNASAYAWHLKAKACIGLADYSKALRASAKAVSIDSKQEYLDLNENIQNFLDFDSNDLVLNSHANSYDNMVELTRMENIELLSKKKLNEPVYSLILDSIVEDAISSTQLTGDIHDEITRFTMNFVDIDFNFEMKDLGDKRVMLGSYGFNRIGIDGRMKKTVQISTMIHELAHHLLSEIFKQAMMHVYDSSKTDTLEAFSWYCLTQDVYWYLMNEYCANRVQNHYMPYNYDNYESFNRVLSKNQDLDCERVIRSVKLANCLADDIILMLDGFIGEELKEEIKLQYLSDRIILPKKEAKIKSDEKYGEKEKFEMINMILRQNLLHIKINLSYSELYMFKRIFSYVNEK